VNHVIGTAASVSRRGDSPSIASRVDVPKPRRRQRSSRTGPREFGRTASDTEGVIDGSRGCEPLTDPTCSQEPHPRKAFPKKCTPKGCQHEPHGYFLGPAWKWRLTFAPRKDARITHGIDTCKSSLPSRVLDQEPFPLCRERVATSSSRISRRNRARTWWRSSPGWRRDRPCSHAHRAEGHTCGRSHCSRGQESDEQLGPGNARAEVSMAGGLWSVHGQSR